jgi:hypothetical protein
MIGQQLKSSASIEYSERQEDAKDYILSSRLKTTGKNFFGFYKKEGRGELIISDEGFIKEFKYHSDNKNIFFASLITNKEDE